MQIKIKTPAKINLTLEITGKRDDGFHNIQSIMQMIDLYDYLTIEVKNSDKTDIYLSGTNPNIPYNEKNIVYKAIKLFIEKVNLKPYKFSVYIEKNIPIEAGLAGGSTNAAGTLLAINKLFDEPLTQKELHDLCAKLGSDLNVCLQGGCTLATGRGEKVESITFREYPVSLIKPHIGISAKEGYQKYSLMSEKCKFDNTHKMIDCLNNNKDIKHLLYNDLETAVYPYYPDLKKIKSTNPNAIMSGSGSTYFVLDNKITPIEDFWIKSGLKTISTGCEII